MSFFRPALAFALAFAITVSLGGCAASPTRAYVGAKPSSDDEVHVLTMLGTLRPDPANAESLTIPCADGLSLKRSAFAQMFGGPEAPDYITLAPGPHDLVAHYELDRIISDIKLSFTALAGHDYVINRTTDGFTVTLWLEDADSRVKTGTQAPYPPQAGLLSCIAH